MEARVLRGMQKPRIRTAYFRTGMKGININEVPLAKPTGLGSSREVETVRPYDVGKINQNDARESHESHARQIQHGTPTNNNAYTVKKYQSI
jgi:hypothetical protein